MLQIANQLSPNGVACRMVMRCGNCRKAVGLGFVVDGRAPDRVQALIDEAALELWGGFSCEACDYDRAYVLSVGLEAPASVTRAERPPSP